MRMRLGELQEKRPEAELRHQWIPYERISDRLKRAVVAAEDDKFIDHEGFDWEGMQKALEKNQRKGKVVAGGSTISQQLAKNLFLSGQDSFGPGFGSSLFSGRLTYAAMFNNYPFLLRKGVGSFL